MPSICHNCNFENPAGAKFCGNCGAAQTAACQNCQHHNPIAFKFCNECGTRLTTSDRRSPTLRPHGLGAAAEHKQEPSNHEAPAIGDALASLYGAERRHLTVLFCDIVGSTKLSQELELEDYRDLIRKYESVCASVIADHDGYVAQFLGDGLLAYFGYPQAAEDDAARAARAGLALVDQINALEITHSLSVRVGIHTGQVVIGDDPGQSHSRDNTAVGDTPNIAARIQSLAQPGEVMVSDSAIQLLRGQFATEERGQHQLKGVARSVTVYCVKGQMTQAGWYAAQEQGALTPFVGREQELTLVMERWRRARGGAGQAVLLTGENGMGKSRLIRVVRDHIAHDEHILLRHYCSPYQQNRPFHPFIDAIERALELDHCESAEEKREKLSAILNSQNMGLSKFLQPVAALLSIPLPGISGSEDTIPKASKEQIFEALFALLNSRCKLKPVIFVVEDIHWADATTLEFIGRIFDPLPSLPILLILSYRPQFVPAWRMRDYGIILLLDRLADGDVSRMISGVAGGKRLPPEVTDMITERTDGVPLFVEETTKMIMGSSALEKTEEGWVLSGPLSNSEIPETLQDSLMARLDRMGRAKEVAQIAATIGRRFTYPIIVKVAQMPEEQVAESLQKMVEADLITQRGLAPQSAYMFRQTLMQNIAYDSLLRAQRQAYHARIADVLETEFPDIAEMQPDMMARHLSVAGRTSTAIDYCMRAADHTLRSSAITETLGHVEASLSMLEALPPGEVRDQQELRIRVAQGTALIAREGYSSLNAYDCFERARPLAERVGNVEDHAKTLLGLFASHYTYGRIEKMTEMAGRLMALAADADNDAIKVPAYLASGSTCMDIADYDAARNNYEAALELLSDPDVDRFAFIYAQDIGVMCLASLSYIEWILGAPSKARERVEQAMLRAESLGHPFSLTFALIVTGSALAGLGDWQAIRENATQTARIAKEHGFESWEIHSEIYLALVAAKDGDNDAAKRRLERALNKSQTVWRAGVPTNARTTITNILLLTGQFQRALEQAEIGLKRTRTKGGQGLVPELHRLAGAALLALGKNGPAQDRIRQAFDLAIDRDHVMLAIRAGNDLLSLEEGPKDIDMVRSTIRSLLERIAITEHSPDLEKARTLIGTDKALAV